MIRATPSRRRLVASALVVGTLACGGSVAEEPDGRRHFLWRVEGGATTVHLLGSIHALPDDAYPLEDPIESAFRGAKVVAFETDLDGLEGAAVKLVAAGTLPNGGRLEEVVGADLYREVTTVLAASGMPRGALDRSRPWFAALTLTSLEMARVGFDADNGVDMHLWRRAVAEGTRRVALETVDAQLALFTSMDAEDGVAFLSSTLADLHETETMLGEIAAAWRAGGVDEIHDLLGEGMEEHPGLMRRLVDDRNRAWLPRVVELARGEDPAMVVVGALHLVGPNGLVELLRAEGFTVTQL